VSWENAAASSTGGDRAIGGMHPANYYQTDVALVLVSGLSGYSRQRVTAWFGEVPAGRTTVRCRGWSGRNGQAARQP
jgi:hypothetical protein